MTRFLITTRTGGKSSTTFIKGLDTLGISWLCVDPTEWNDHMWNMPPVDVAVIFGCRKDDIAIKESAKARGIPTVIVDLGYVNRFNEAYRTTWDNEKTLCVSFGDFPGWIPPFPCSPDRRESLGIRYPRLRCNPKGEVLIIGQWPDDLTHPFRSNNAMNLWATKVADRIPHEKVHFRPHPRSTKQDMEFLEEAFDRAKCVVTWGSNTGNDALLYGLPVITEAGGYKCITEDLVNLEDFVLDWWFPDEDSWYDYFNRLAYGQWTFSEFERGEAQKFIVEVLERGVT